MLKIKSFALTNPVIQSPMAGCTDLAFRIIAREHGLELAMTEMISAEALVRDHKKTLSLLQRAPSDTPTGCQIVGPNSDSMARAAEMLEPLNFALIDINCGCPVRKITGQEAGAALMKDPKRAEKIFLAVVKSVKKLPVTVKMRSGYADASGKEAVRLAKIAQDCGLAAVTVHGRTKSQLYSGKADWSVITKVKAAIRIPVFGNGDIFSAPDAVRMRKETGCDGVVTGRGALGNPWLYENIHAAFGHRKGHVPSLQDIKRTALKHMKLTAKFDGEKIAHLKSRHIVCWYFKGCPGASKLRDTIHKSKDFEELCAAVRAYEGQA